MTPRRIVDRDDINFNPGAEPREGEVGFTPVLVNPQCRGMCKGDRPAWDSPAQWGRDQSGRKLIFCPCCNVELVPAKVEVAEEQRRVIEQVRPPNLHPELQAEDRILTCKTCRYDVHVLRNVKPL